MSIVTETPKSTQPAQLSWWRLCAMEPQLFPLADHARRMHRERFGDPDWRQWSQLKRELEPLIGWGRRDGNTALGTPAAWSIATKTLLDLWEVGKEPPRDLPPVFVVERDPEDDSMVRFRCPACQRDHHHNPPEGTERRAAHCAPGTELTGFCPSGYFIRFDEGESR